MTDWKTVNLVELAAGDKVRMADGAIAEVVENPQDGFWITVRYLEHPAGPAAITGEEVNVFATDIESVQG
ncbi:hypothetical protein [Bordetella genomosp. 9]|uniref:DUF4926 domain-containing protein n=1 Tax=Bordetella genomosp. 9 TaxID=1416803 RepID=A0A1W6YXH2_9BORD|nr:hypothetical protein [Bordetella genomosp. 9]ARP85691.1 hypothetical protein CAL13_05310 [Bordetella genomosp. 9]ARP89667.1 hypothetical protein CAL14_04685 [Bordetella genomosp. 9]